MNLYTSQQTQNIHKQTFAFLKVKEADHVLSITLDRAQKKNALHPQLVNELAYAMHYAHFEKDIWMVLFAAKGNVFCAGADLKAMAGFVEEHNSTIPEPSETVLIGDLFKKIHKPTISKITGDVYAGGFFFLAGSNIVIAQDDLKFGLPEVKRGLYPFQVMAALLKIMPERKVIDWCIRGYNLPVAEAEKYGLVSKVCAADEIETETQKVIDELKQNSPSAMRLGLQAYNQISTESEQHQYLMDMFMKTIASKDGQEGMKAFREKRSPVWTGE